jgi:hypothetical protein
MLEIRDKHTLTVEIFENAAHFHPNLVLDTLIGESNQHFYFNGVEWFVLVVDYTGTMNRLAALAVAHYAILGNCQVFHLDEPELGWHEAKSCTRCRANWHIYGDFS